MIARSLTWPAEVGADDASPTAGERPSRTDVAAAIARFNLGKQMIARGDYAHAIAELERAYELDPRSEHLYNLAVAHQNNAQRDQAIAYYRRYLAAAPDGKLAADAERYLYKLEAEAAAERAEHDRATATAALADATAARAEASAARAELAAAHQRADRAELAARTALADRPTPAIRERDAPPPGIDQGIAEDASSGRGWVMPTALMAPAGTWTLSDYELIAVAGSYAVTDRLALSIGTVLPVDSQRVAGASAKLQLFGSPRVRIAAQSALAVSWTGDGDPIGLASAGGAVTLCIDLACRSHLSGYLGAGLVHDKALSGLVIAGGSLALALGTHMKAVLELENGTGYDLARGALGWYGLRFNARAFTFDLGLATPLGAAADRWDTSILPFLSFTYRSSTHQGAQS